MDRTRRRLSALPLMAGLAAFARPAHAQTRPDLPSSAATVKAAFLLNFIRYTEWPALPSDAPIVTCFVGRDPAALAAAAIDGRAVGGRRVQMRRLTAPDDLTGCHVAYVDASEERRIARLLASVDGSAVLTVSDAGGFVEQGGVIELVEAGDRFEFDINFTRAQRAGLRLSSQLLTLARRVPGRPR
ncbi:MAG: YfiR family protein [Burkholderiaceae bacterium]|jgi:hypothetical protein|nr:YfiR family protein [Burkholderiaceae bacterium]